MRSNGDFRVCGGREAHKSSFSFLKNPSRSNEAFGSSIRTGRYFLPSSPFSMPSGIYSDFLNEFVSQYKYLPSLLTLTAALTVIPNLSTTKPNQHMNLRYRFSVSAVAVDVFLASVAAAVVPLVVLRKVRGI